MEDKIKKIEIIIQMKVGAIGGWCVPDEEYDKLCNKAAKEIAELFTKEETNCICTVDETTGNTMVRCCNICGKPLESENWNTLKQ